nr:MAG TPA: putative nucleic-acid-binding protein [Caudoviricetes sp.]
MSDESLEKLKVVIEASANPFREEMKKLRKEMNDSSKVVDDQMKNIKADMDKTMEPIRKVQAQIRRIGETMKNVLGKSLPGNQFKDMSNSIEKTQKKLDKLIAAKHELEDSGKDMELTKSYRELESSAAKAEERLLKLKGNISALESAGLDMEYTDDFKELMKVTDAAEKKLNSYIEQEDRMKATGTVNKKSNSWKNLQYNIEQTRNTYNAYKMDMANATPSEKYQNTASWKKLQAEIEQTEKKLAEYKSEMESLSESEKVQPTDKWRKVQKEIYDTRIELAQMNEEQQKYEKSVRVSRVSKVFKNVLNTFKSLGQSIKKSGGLFASLIQKFRNGIPWFNKTRNSMHGLGNSGSRLGNIFRTLGMTARFMFASFAITGTINGAKEGLKNLAQYSDTTNASISALYSDLITLKNAFAVAFAPILNVVTPILDTFITYLIDAANAVAQFFSALTGSPTWTKATKVQKDYAGSLNNTASAAAAAKKELYGFDEITKQSDDSSSGSGGAGGSIGSMFGTEEVSNQFSNFAQMVKDAWKDADFSEIGEIVGTKIRDGLDSINWDAIQETCNKIAKSIATFINGFIGTEGLAESIGSTIGNAINTGVGMAHTFFSTTNFVGLGEFIATTANTAIMDTTDWGLIGETVAEGLKSGIETWYGFVTTFNFEGLGEKIGDSIKRFFREMGEVNEETGLTGWKELGVSIGTTISGFADTIVTAFEDGVNWEEIKSAVGELISGIFDNLDVNVGKLIITIAGFSILKGGLVLTKEIIKNAILAKITGSVGAAASGLPLITIAAILGITLTAIWWMDEYGHPILNDIGQWLSEKITGEVVDKDALNKLIEGTGLDSNTKFSDFLKNLSQLSLLSDEDRKLFNKISDKYLGEGRFDWSTYLSLPKSWELCKKRWSEAISWFKGNVIDKIQGFWDKLKAFFGTPSTVKDGVGGGSKEFKVKDEINSTGGKMEKELSVRVKSRTTADEIYNPLQASFSKKALTTATKTTSGVKLHEEVQGGITSAGAFHNAVKSTTTGNMIFDFIQSDFMKNKLHTATKSDTNGRSIFGWVQGAFGQSIFHTGAKSDTSGSTIHQTVQNTFGAQSLSTSAMTTNSGTDLRNTLQASFGGTPLSIGVSLVRNGWNTLTDWVNSFFGGGHSGRGTTITRRADGGLFSGGVWHPVTAYAGGGSPASGQFFMAREAGPELVGTIGRHTAVMNNNQIVSSVSDGVYSAVLSAMSQTARSNSTPMELHVYVGGEKVTDYVIKDINGRTVSTGKCPILT